MQASAPASINDSVIQDLLPTQRELLRAVRAGDHDLLIWIGAIRAGKGVGSAVALIDAAIRNAMNGADIRQNQFVVGGATQSSFLRNNEGYLFAAAQLAGLQWAYRGSAKGLGAHLELGPGIARFFVFGGENSRSFYPVRGLTLRGAWLDEVTLMDDLFFTTCIERFSFDDAFMIATSNAGSPLHWLKTDWIDNAPETTLNLQSSFDENRYYSDVRRERLRALDPNTPNYRRALLNEWAPDSGLIIPIPPDALTDEEYEPRGDVYLDPGTAGTTAALLFVRRSYGWLVADEYYHIGDRQGRLTDEAHLDVLQSRWRINRLVIDPAGASMRQAAAARGLAPRYANNEFEAGIQVVNNALHRGVVKIAPRCRELQMECASYKWNERERMPEVGPDHLADCLRYGAIDKFPTLYAGYIK